MEMIEHEYPIYTHQSELYYDVNEVYNTFSNFTTIYELNLGIDKLEMDDSFFQIGFSHITYKYLNIQRFVKYTNQWRWYTNDENKPILIFALTLGNRGQLAERIAYDIAQALARIGGILKFATFTFGFLIPKITKYKVLAERVLMMANNKKVYD